MIKETKREVWVGRMAEFSASGLSQKQWCEENQVPLAQFAYWRRRLRELGGVEGEVSKGTTSWCAVRLAPETRTPVTSPNLTVGGLTVRVGEASIEVEPGFDAQLLRSVVQALESRSC